MTGVHTVRGVIAPEDLGRCLPHEHLRCDFSPVTQNLDHVLVERELVIEELRAFVTAGGAAVVDTTPIDLGRDPQALQDISTAADIHVVMGTGWYHKRFYPPEIDTTSTDELAATMVAELLEGVAGNGVTAGVIGEIGVDGGVVSAREERVLRAAARASRATGAPVTTHASLHPVGLAQLDLLLQEGVDPSRVVIGHADTYLDADYHRGVLEQGAWLQFDTCGREHMNPDTLRVRHLLRLLENGWLDRLLLSSDRCFRSDMTAFGGLGYAHVLTGFRQRLVHAGVDDATFDALTITNPARMLSW